MRFAGICYRAQNPVWSFKPTSGDGAALRGARFNPKGVPSLYLALTIIGAVKEANQGLAHRIDPCVLCAYDVDCVDIADLRTEAGRDAAGIRFEDMSCGWMDFLARGERPPSWSIYDRLCEASAGILVPSFAPGAVASDFNLVLWRWGDAPHKVEVIDPEGRLPRSQASWAGRP
ncbi:RES domain-containing protein [Nordella sp. HKS 07]|uniref:RES family NAD+ phosphorylase n=1 Tax=Nordella sp. HKS 07 TaxID=2712222 RepID=UPI0013E189B5|nr:RES domain-containing protein [Nordella sp. HKS 07]QIG51328.1 RES domain-containing protein [Nordella sp. HKS 07]